MTFDEAASVFVLAMAALLLGWRYRPRLSFGRLGATIRHVARLFIMSRPHKEEPVSSDTSAVHVPVPSTDTSGGTAPEARDISGDRWPMSVTTRDTDQVIVTYLAAQKRPDGKYRFSANEIYTLVKGPRAEVLAQVRAIREGPPEPVYAKYPPQFVAANGHED
jgi:hypothetical protein